MIFKEINLYINIKIYDVVIKFILQPLQRSVDNQKSQFMTFIAVV